MSVRRVSLLVLRCADLERSRLFYEALGLQLNPEQHGAGSKHYSCAVGGLTLELYPLAGKSTSGLRLGLVVSGLDRAVGSLRAKGITVTAIDEASAIVADPDGHQITLEEGPAD